MGETFTWHCKEVGAEDVVPQIRFYLGDRLIPGVIAVSGNPVEYPDGLEAIELVIFVKDVQLERSE